MQKRMRECPFAVMPLHKEIQDSDAVEGCFLTMVAQAQMPQHVLLTPLLAYQEHQGNAVPHVVATFYQELAPSKGICLIRVDVLDGQLVGKNECVRLIYDLVKCYTQADLYEHVMTINHDSARFNLDTFVKELHEHRENKLEKQQV
jgi:hypothetical protein